MQHMTAKAEGACQPGPPSGRQRLSGPPLARAAWGYPPSTEGHSSADTAAVTDTMWVASSSWQKMSARDTT
jgi:hypothetical protein